MAKRKPRPVSFEDRWILRRHECGQDDLRPPEFLKCGDAILPTEAAPFLSFDEAERGPRLWVVFGPKDSWSAADKKRVAGYRVIGSDGCGNPICLEDGTGFVWMLDHEDHFSTRRFVNSSVSLLAESLLACIGERKASRLLAAIKKIDPPGAAKKSFWDEAAQSLESVEDAGGGG